MSGRTGNLYENKGRGTALEYGSSLPHSSRELARAQPPNYCGQQAGLSESRSELPHSK
jgi:hypothetical protein